MLGILGGSKQLSCHGSIYSRQLENTSTAHKCYDLSLRCKMYMTSIYSVLHHFIDRIYNDTTHRKVIRLNWLCNPTGKAHAFRAVDLLVERNNLYTKVSSVCCINIITSKKHLPLENRPFMQAQDQIEQLNTSFKNPRSLSFIEIAMLRWRMAFISSTGPFDTSILT